MSRIVLMIFCCLLTMISLGQNTTEDLIRAIKVKEYIILKPVFNSNANTVDLSVDKDPSAKVNQNLPGNTIFSMRPGRQMNILSSYYNPLKIKVILSDSAFVDENTASIAKFFEAITSTFNSIPGLNLSNATAGGNTAAAGASSLFKNETLADWLIDYRKMGFTACTPDLTALINTLTDLDESYFSIDASNFEGQVKSILKKLLDANSLAALSLETGSFSANIQTLKSSNVLTKAYYSAADVGVKALILNEPSPAPVTSMLCMQFAHTSKIKLGAVITEANKIQAAREKIVEDLDKLKDELNTFISNNSQELVHLGRYPAELDYVHAITVKYIQRDVNFDDEKRQIVISNKKELTSNKFHLRGDRLFIAEFGTGGFYTNLTYPKFGVREENGEILVTEVKAEKYPVVLAAHLNMVVNAYNYWALPMLQIGIGTAKERPSLLGGVGLRFSKPNRLAVTYGRIWTWKKELNTLGLNSKVKGTADVENDLRLILDRYSSGYVGIQYNF
jgi:hypothetical protein